MRMYKPRGLNVDESYACSRTSVRKCFEGQDISVMWGDPHSFNFDSKMRKLPKIEACVVASMVISYCVRSTSCECTLNFYIIRDPAYNNRIKTAFEDICLPRLKEWHRANTEQNQRGGIDQMLVEWTGSAFCFQEIHFA